MKSKQRREEKYQVSVTSFINVSTCLHQPPPVVFIAYYTIACTLQCSRILWQAVWLMRDQPNLALLEVLARQRSVGLVSRNIDCIYLTVRYILYVCTYSQSTFCLAPPTKLKRQKVKQEARKVWLVQNQTNITHCAFNNYIDTLQLHAYTVNIMKHWFVYICSLSIMLLDA